MDVYRRGGPPRCYRFQASFMQMERGLEAFRNFVPQSVVKVLIAGRMELHRPPPLQCSNAPSMLSML